MPVERDEVDEVQLALEQAYAAFFRDGHQPSEAIDACQSCHAMLLVKRAILLYATARVRPSPPDQSDAS